MKSYNGEKAIISLTSWKKRINDVAKTIFSILKFGTDYHIVLVLSSDEFPKKEKELPENLTLLLDNNLIELLWVKKNYKSFKKVIFTIKKYPNTPIISADDGCIYIKNIANELYDNWLKNKDCISSYAKYKSNNIEYGGSGRGMIFPPNCFKDYAIKFVENNDIINTNHDDAFYGVLANKMNIKFKYFCTSPRQQKTFKNIISNEKFGLCINKQFSVNCFPFLISTINI